jgi:sugar lactone lactonase YvrE
MRWLVVLLMSLCTMRSVHAQLQPYVFESDALGILEPTDVGFDAEGRLLIAAGREGLLRVEPDGTRTSVAAGRCDRVPGRGAIAEPALHRVLVGDGSSRRVIDGAAWPIGRLRAPESAALAPDGSIWIADTGNARVVRVSPDGSAAAFGERGFFPGQFVAPAGIAFDEGGPLVSDRLNHRVTRLAWDGSYRDLFGLHAFRPREGKGKIHYPQALAFDERTGRVAVAEPFERRVQIFRRPRPDEVRRAVPPMPSKDGVNSHFGPDCAVGGDIVAAWEPESGCVVLWDTRRDPPAHVSTFGGTGDRPGAFRGPSSVLVEPDGRAVWVLDALGDRLERWVLARDPKDPVQFDPFMPRLAVGLPLSVARSEAALPEVAGTELVWREGRVGVVFADGSLGWTDPAMARFQGESTRTRVRDGLGSVRAAAVDGKGRLLILWPEGIEIRGDKDAEFLSLARVASDPRGIADLGAAFAVSDAARDSIVRILPSGEASDPMAAPRPPASRFDGAAANEDGQFWIPARMAGGGGKPLFIVDYGNHRLQRFGADGRWEATFSLSKSRAREKTAPSEAPSAEEMQRAEARRQEAMTRARDGHGALDIPGGGRLEWSTNGPVPRGEPFTMRVRAFGPDGKPLEGHALGVDCTMPHHGHGMNVQPVITRTAPGCWTVDPMLLHMPGRWELCFDLAGADSRNRRSQCTLEVE